MVKRGVVARTTWWNWQSDRHQFGGARLDRAADAHGHGDEVQAEVGDGNVDGVQDAKGAEGAHLLLR